ncbi:hypothetical protein KZ483_02365 [Paenibacillus sp. sptzw28]|uniref:carboxypeptidase-like regulatory domain-containing protein n=1 Tax=Paenibacillus sp. sptzw28 TaxID=715179 RepID=UPI001C6DD542|nr:carboxypeptidase-like regulatory domain-containing protein [Paenibacillus sp. sptzw28]QYR21903.1 hypothetical protein KZ483_02365 [Paenibacillus sp. sptzw28]
MKIKIKVKHLILLIALAFILLPLIGYVILPNVKAFVAVKRFDQGSVNGKQAVIELINGSLTAKKKWELIRTKIIEQGPNSLAAHYDVYVGPGSSQVNGDEGSVTHFSWPEKQPYLEAYLKGGPVDGYLARTARQLAYYYNMEGKQDQAMQALELGEKRLTGKLNDSQRLGLMLDRARLAVNNGDDDTVEQVIDQMAVQLGPSRSYMDSELARLRAQLLISRGSLKEALDQINNALDEHRRELGKKTEQFPEEKSVSVTEGQMDILKEKLERAIKQGGKVASTVNGSVKQSDGTPMPYVGVFLRNRTDVNHSVVEGEPYQTMTDTHGNFSFKGVLPDSYQLYLGLSFEQIDGWTWPVQNDEWIDVKGNERLSEEVVLHPLLQLISPVNQRTITGEQVDFQWEPVEGAAYYQLNGQIPIKDGSVGTILRTNIRNHYIQIPIETMYDMQTGLAFAKSGDWSTVEPATLLGYANTEARFSWDIEAYDRNGRLLSRSSGYRLNKESMGNLPFFYLKERKLTIGDRTLLERRPAQAFSAYKNALEKDPRDIHSLRMVIRLLQSQASILGKKEAEKEALPYIKRMIELNPAENYIYMLVDYYYTNEDWIAFNAYYKQYIRTLTDPPSAYVQSIYATALMKQGKLKEAEREFTLALRRDRSHRFVGNMLALNLYTEGIYESALALAKTYPERSYGEEGRDWSNLIKQLIKEAQRDPSLYSRELHEKLGWYIQGEDDKLNRWTTTTTYMGMKAFIQALLVVK